MKHTWFKYHTCHAWGSGKMEYVCLFYDPKITTASQVKDEFLQSVADEYNWSDKWRGIIHSRFRPGKKRIRDLMQEKQQQIEYYALRKRKEIESLRQTI